MSGVAPISQSMPMRRSRIAELGDKVGNHWRKHQVRYAIGLVIVIVVIMLLVMVSSKSGMTNNLKGHGNHGLALQNGAQTGTVGGTMGTTYEAGDSRVETQGGQGGLLTAEYGSLLPAPSNQCGVVDPEAASQAFYLEGLGATSSAGFPMSDSGLQAALTGGRYDRNTANRYPSQ